MEKQQNINNNPTKTYVYSNYALFKLDTTENFKTDVSCEFTIDRTSAPKYPKLEFII